jgi:hypothetical protein
LFNQQKARIDKILLTSSVLGQQADEEVDEHIDEQISRQLLQELV